MNYWKLDSFGCRIVDTHRNGLCTHLVATVFPLQEEDSSGNGNRQEDAKNQQQGLLLNAGSLMTGPKGPAWNGMGAALGTKAAPRAYNLRASKLGAVVTGWAWNGVLVSEA